MKIQSQVVAVSFVVLALVSCKHEPFLTGTGGSGNPNDTTGTGLNGSVCFESDILPMITSGCAKSGCHDAASHEEGYVLDSYNNIMKKGIVPGKATSSKLYQVLFASGSDRMPQPPNAAFTSGQKELFAKWINEGAKNTTNCNVSKCDTTTVTYSKSIAPLMTNNCIGCHSTSLANGGYDFTNYNGVKLSVTFGRLLGSINYQAGFSGMPQGYHLNACQLATITKWVKEGALNN